MTSESKSEKSEDYYRNLVYEYKYDKNLISLIRSIKKRLSIKWDCVAVVDGEEGAGKSSLAILLGYLLDKDFDLDKNISYLPLTHEVENKFYSIKSEQVLVVDEAIKALYKLRFMDKMQARINTMYATERKQRKITLLCIPRFTDLNEFFRNDRVQFWIHVVDRGLAVAFVKDRVNIFGSDRWHMKEEYKRINVSTYKKKFAEMTTEDMIKIYQKSQHFWFAFTFPQLPPEVEEKYLDTREMYNEKPAKIIKDNAVDRVDSLLWLKEQKNLNLTIDEMSDILQCNSRLISEQIAKKKIRDRIPSKVKKSEK